MRYVLVLISVLAASAAAHGQLQQLPQQPPPQQKGLVVHEWGVFRVHQDVEMANADVRGEWRDLPDFVYGQVQGRKLPENWGVTEFRRRPIVFFHSPTPVQV